MNSPKQGIPALRQIGHPNAVETLVFLIKQPENPNFARGYGAATARQAAVALAHFPSEQGPRALVALLGHAEFDIAQIESDIAPALVQSGTPLVVNELLAFMAAYPAPEQSQQFDPDFMPQTSLAPLVNLLCRCWWNTVAAKQGEAKQENNLLLQRLARSLSLIHHETAVDALVTISAHQQPEVVMQAIVSLGLNRHPSALPALRTFAAQPSENPDIRKTVAWAIAQQSQ